MLPSTMKILFGFLSDNVPILGYRRKPYMLIGWTLASLVIWSFYFTSNLSMHHDGVIPVDAPSIEKLSAIFFAFGIFMWLADVMGDALVVCESCSNPVYSLYLFLYHISSNLVSSALLGRKGPTRARRVERAITIYMLCVSIFWTYGFCSNFILPLQHCWSRLRYFSTRLCTSSHDSICSCLTRRLWNPNSIH